MQASERAAKADQDTAGSVDAHPGVVSGTAAEPSGSSGSSEEVSGLSEDSEDDDDLEMPLLTSGVDGQQIVLRPGIVHRLDKGTTGLMVVCKDDTALTHLAAQFKSRKVQRIYWSITAGVPPKSEGIVETNIGRHPTDRKKMGVYGYGSQRGREAVSTYKVIEELADGTAALVQWRLKSGRTHQIRVHAQYLGCPLLGDDDYGGTGAALSVIGRGIKSRDACVRPLVKELGRPALHAKTLGFDHPFDGRKLDFQSTLPADFEECLQGLRNFPPLLV